MNAGNDTVEINICDLLSKKDKYIEQVELETISNKYEIPLHQLLKYSRIHQNDDQILKNLRHISNKIKIYEARGLMKEKNISDFIKIINEEKVEINIDEYWSIYRLIKLFKIGLLEEYFERYSIEHSTDIDFLINLKLEYENIEENRTRQKNHHEKSNI